MIEHSKISDTYLRTEIKNSRIRFGANKKLKIYGKLRCNSGKRMKRVHRVFFKSESEALANDYRPCGHCMRVSYKIWKTNFQNN